VTSAAPGVNNLFKAWYLSELCKQGLPYFEAEAVKSVAWKAKFLEWVEEVCREKVYELTNNKHYNVRLF
jgi:hypothetical protein